MGLDWDEEGVEFELALLKEVFDSLFEMTDWGTTRSYSFPKESLYLRLTEKVVQKDGIVIK